MLFHLRPQCRIFHWYGSNPISGCEVVVVDICSFIHLLIFVILAFGIYTGFVCVTLTDGGHARTANFMRFVPSKVTPL